MVQGRKMGVDMSLNKCSLYFGNLNKSKFSLVNHIGALQILIRLFVRYFEKWFLLNLQWFHLVRFLVTEKFSTEALHLYGSLLMGSNNVAAALAYQIGTKTDFMLGGDLHPVVDWAETEPEIDPAEMAKVKIAFVGNLPHTANEDFLLRLFGPIGKVEKVALSRKSRQPVGFVHFSARADLDRAIREMNGRIISAPDKGSPFTIQVSVAKPQKGTKRPRDEDAKVKLLENPTEKPDYSQGQCHHDLAVPPTLKVPRLDPSVRMDAYEASLALLSPVVRDRLNRLFRLGIGTRYDIDIHCVNSLKELPEQAAIAALDQFLFLGSEKHDKRAFFDSLVAKQRVNLLTRSSSPLPRREYSRAPPIEPPLDHPPRYIGYSSSPGLYRNSQHSKEPPFSRPLIGELKGEPASLHRDLQVATPSLGYGSGPSSEEQISPPVSLDRQIRYDPLTGQPYKFDPFTGEPINPEFSSHRYGSLH